MPVRPALRFLSTLALVLGSPAAEWAEDAVWYQIFPERFRNGDPSNDPTRDSLELPLRPSGKWHISPWTGDWYERADWEKELGPDFYGDGVFERRYGGDLQGILGKLDYLSDLGINAIYLNPVFKARSLHRYDGDGFHHIDPHLGPDPAGDATIIAKENPADPSTWRWTAADRLFLRLLGEARKRGIRVIIDGVWNHTGRDFFAFADIRRNQAASPFKDWYAVESFDDPATEKNEFRYKGWWGYERLPVFKASDDGTDMAPGPKAYVFAVTQRWMDPDGDGDPGDGVDGWRLDVAGELPVKFWADWHAHVRKLNPGAYTSCEEWGDPRVLLERGGFDAAMNYHGFAAPVRAFLAANSIRASEFSRLLDERRAALPARSLHRMQNLTGSHDTERIASMIVNAALKPPFNPRDAFTGPSSARNSADYQVRKPDASERAIQRMIVLFQATYVGAPMFYYGDEAGMWGGNDPDDRMPMLWDDLIYRPQAADPRGRARKPDAVAFDRELFRFHKEAISLRKNHAVLRGGGYRAVGTFDDEQSFAFVRRDESEILLAVFNRSGQERTLRIELPEEEMARFARGRQISPPDQDGAVSKVRKAENALLVTLPPLSAAIVSP